MGMILTHLPMTLDGLVAVHQMGACTAREHEPYLLLLNLVRQTTVVNSTHYSSSTKTYNGTKDTDIQIEPVTLYLKTVPVNFCPL
eukprot:SAG11_NODE_52_length_19809_cov_14.064231_2_plen_85_part_00